MKNSKVSRLVGLALIPFATLLVSCGDVGDSSEATTGEKVEVKEGGGGTYVIDTAQSDVQWVAAKVTRSHDGGFNIYDGTVNVENGEVNHVIVNIDTRSIFTDTDKLTEHLKSEDFFKVESHPTAKFEASDFKKVDSAGFTHMVTGNLTMLDVTKGVTFPANISVADGVVKATSDFIINRKDWNINYTGAPDDLIKDDVRIKMNITAKQSS